MKKILALMMAAAMLLSITPASLAEAADEGAKMDLIAQVTEAATSYIATDDMDFYMYKDMNWSSIADTLPAKFDLRDRGVVPEIRNQGAWGTCWAFATIAAAETSMLSSLGLTCEQYAEITGSSFDLSEKHLAWFATGHLPTLDQYAEGEYPYPESQAGEGMWHTKEDTNPTLAHYQAGGFMGYSAGIFANGVGPLTEAMYPYTANDGSASTEADWSIDESARFLTIAEIKNSSILPSPSQRDENGNYVYNAAGTEAIKKELLAGRGVSIGYHGDLALSQEAQVNIAVERYTSQGMDKEAARLYISASLGMLDPEAFTQEERVTFMKAVAFLGKEEGYSADSTQEELEALTEARFEHYVSKLRGSEEKQTTEQPAAEQSIEEQYEANVAESVEAGMDREAAEIAARIILHINDPADVTREEREILMKALLLMQGMPEDSITQETIDLYVDTQYDSTVKAMLGTDTADTGITAEQEAALREAAEKLGRDYDTYKGIIANRNAAGQEQYIRTDTYAQYTDNQYAMLSHAVTIIGWDDDYAVENFPEDHQPPAPGAWIVRNSWGESYGVEGGFLYLSYYDQTITAPETFEFVFDRNVVEGGVKIEGYDNMEANCVSSAHLETPVYSANIFPVDEECALSYVSVMTADLNAKLTAAVYLLNENYTSPVDGVMLDIVTAEIEFGGYHRIALNHIYQLPAGSVISVVQMQESITTQGLRYTLPFTNASGEEAAMCIETVNPSGMPVVNWFVGKIGEGESFVNVDGTWYDWKDIVTEVQENNSFAALVSFDNMNIKAYFYSVDGVHAAHKFGAAQAYMGAEVLVCEECGETLIVVK